MGIFLVGGIGRTTCEHSVYWISGLRVYSSWRVCRIIGLSVFSSGWVICFFGPGVRRCSGGDISGGELDLVSARTIYEKLKDTARYGREKSTRFFLGRARVRDNLDIGYRASVIFGTSELVQGWIDLRFG